MALNSFSFIICFVCFIGIFSLLQLFRGKKPCIQIIQKLLLLLFSYVFILISDWRFCTSIVLVTLLSFLFGKVLEKKASKAMLALGCFALISILVYYKYSGFFINSFRSIVGYGELTLKVILPIGISFYVFSSIAYLIDVYRRKYPAENNILNFALFISFFPKLTAGPIVRGEDFLQQAKDYRGIQWNEFKIGIQIFVFGLFKKIVLADRLGVFVDDVFHAPTAYNTGTLILAVLSYSLQIYFDFSGYSDMAIGVSKTLGFDFKHNFNLPYLAQNNSDFWRRWHISLSSWFKDYLYIPLGGSKKGRLRTYFNLIIVMLISGLWHGAGWTYIIWGALHGIASCINKAFYKKFKMLGVYANSLITYIIVTLFWVVFRAEDFNKAIKIWIGIFTSHSGISQPYTWSFFAIACLVIATIIAWIHSKNSGSVDKDGKVYITGFYPILNLSKFWPLVAFITFCGLTIIMGYFGNTAFIYGSF